MPGDQQLGQLLLHLARQLQRLGLAVGEQSQRVLLGLGQRGIERDREQREPERVGPGDGRLVDAAARGHGRDPGLAELIEGARERQAVVEGAQGVGADQDQLAALEADQSRRPWAAT